MAKRSDGVFARRPQDLYETPAAAVTPLLPHLKPGTRFAEPCVGPGALKRHLEAAGHFCGYASDLPTDARTVSFKWRPTLDMSITNPPWTRSILHPIIVNLSDQLPTWLLFDADWIHTKQAIPYLDRLRKVVSVGRVKWIEGSPHVGKDNVAWHCFGRPSSETCKFYGRLAA